ncbi:MAG: hypothetical protein ACOZF0_19965 [Thermodesulfobacteriota bacterium]
MATVQERFAAKLLGIRDVKGFILARNDGQVLMHRLKSWQPEAVASMMVLSGMDCQHIQQAMGFSHFDFLRLTLRNEENLLVFPVRNYFLGIQSDANRFNAKFAVKIRKFIQEITRQAPRP